MDLMSPAELDELRRAMQLLATELAEHRGEMRIWRETRCSDHSEKISELASRVRNDRETTAKLAGKTAGIVIGAGLIVQVALMVIGWLQLQHIKGP